MTSRFQYATITRFSMREGRGVLRLASGEEMPFHEAAMQATAAELEESARVSVQLGPTSEPGRLAVLRIWLKEPPEWARLGEWVAAPDQALALLHGVGLARGFTVEQFTAACYQARWDAMGDCDIRDKQGQVRATAIDRATLLAALARLYGTSGPTPTSEGDRAFVLDPAAEADPQVRARVQAALERWVGPLVGADIDTMLGEAAGRLAHGEELYSMRGDLDLGDQRPFRLVAVGRPAQLEMMSGPVTRHVRAGR